MSDSELPQPIYPPPGGGGGPTAPGGVGGGAGAYAGGSGSGGAAGGWGGQGFPPPPEGPPGGGGGGSSTPIVIGVVAVIAVIAIIVAVVAMSGDDDGGGSGTASGPTTTEAPAPPTEPGGSEPGVTGPGVTDVDPPPSTEVVDELARRGSAAAANVLMGSSLGPAEEECLAGELAENEPALAVLESGFFGTKDPVVASDLSGMLVDCLGTAGVEEVLLSTLSALGVPQAGLECVASDTYFWTAPTWKSSLGTLLLEDDPYPILFPYC